MNKINITFIDLAGSDFPGGCEKYFSILANFFSSKNKVYFVQSKQYVHFMERFYHILFSHKVGTIEYIKRDIGNSEKLDITFSTLIPFFKNNKEIKIILSNSDIIYSKNEFQELMLLYYLLGRKRFSQKVVIGIHSAIFVPESVKGVWKFIHDLQYNSFFYKKFLNSAKLIHTINSDDEIRINKHYGVDKNKIKYIPNFIDWKTSYAIKRKKDKFIIFWAGRLTQNKGIDRLSIIIEKLSKDNIFNNLEFWIAGGGESQGLVRELESKYRNVRFLGFVKNMNDLYPKIDLAIVTSYFETFGYNVLEPQSFGIPVVCFDIVGPRDIVLQSKTGYLAKDTDEFVEKIYAVYRNKFVNKKIFNIINLKFSKENILKNLQSDVFNNK